MLPSLKNCVTIKLLKLTKENFGMKSYTHNPFAPPNFKISMCYMQMMKKTGGREIFIKSLRSQRHMEQCSHPECRMYAHNLSIGDDRKIINLSQFRGKYDLCFDILHSEECKGLFSVNNLQ